MSANHGWVEPVDASAADAQQDDLEHWLRDIRTDLTDNRSDWRATATAATADAATADAAEAADDADAPPHGPASPRIGNDDPAASDRVETVGRHRAED
jgi:hypothetical protein